MVEHEVELAHRFAQAAESGGYPRIFPVRVAYRQPFQYPLGAYLNPLNWAMWDGEEDTAGLIEELLRAIAGQSLSIAEAAKPALLQPEPSESALSEPALSEQLPSRCIGSAGAVRVSRPRDDGAGVAAVRAAGGGWAGAASGGCARRHGDYKRGAGRWAKARC